MPWWVTTVLGLVGAVATQLAVNCVFGSPWCEIIGAIASAGSLGLGYTHGGNLHFTPSSVIPMKDQVDIKDVRAIENPPITKSQLSEMQPKK